MFTRVLQHILFWLLFVLLYTVTKMSFAPAEMMADSSLERFFRFFLGELALFPWKIIPFYFLFYSLVPRFFKKGNHLKIGLYFLIVLVFCLFGHLSILKPIHYLTYGKVAEFNVYSLRSILYILLDILPAVGLAASLKLFKGRIASQQKEQALEKEKLESELNFLKAQTNPHFLFNTLNNLYGLARKNDANTAPSIMKLSNIMRYILYECSVPSIDIENEVKVIEDYIELEKLRYDERLTINFTTSVDDWKQKIAPLILLPFVENAFKHGASETRFDSLIDMRLELIGKRLHFIIKNTRDSETVENTTVEGIGLKNVKRQLDLIYNDNYTLNIYPKQDVFIVELMIHLASFKPDVSFSYS